MYEANPMQDLQQQGMEIPGMQPYMQQYAEPANPQWQ